MTGVQTCALPICGGSDDAGVAADTIAEAAGRRRSRQVAGSRTGRVRRSRRLAGTRFHRPAPRGTRFSRRVRGLRPLYRGLKPSRRHRGRVVNVVEVNTHDDCSLPGGVNAVAVNSHDNTDLDLDVGGEVDPTPIDFADTDDHTADRKSVV